jgi:hypothetical protein
VLEVDAVAQSAFDDSHLARQHADDRARAAAEAFEAAHVGIRALEHAARSSRPLQGCGDGAAPGFGSGGEQLHDHSIPIAIGDNAWQSVGFGVNDAACGMLGVEDVDRFPGGRMAETRSITRRRRRACGRSQM